MEGFIGVGIFAGQDLGEASDGTVAEASIPPASPLLVLVDNLYWLPLIGMSLWLALRWRSERSYLVEKLEILERANAKLLQSLQRVSAENETLSEKLTSLQKASNDDSTAVVSSVAEANAEEHPSPDLDVGTPESPTVVDVTEEAPSPVPFLQQKKDESEFIEKFCENPCFESALSLLAVGTASEEAAVNILPLLFTVLAKRREEDAEARARHALETNDFAELSRVSADIVTPSVKRARRRLRIIELDEMLQRAAKSTDCAVLTQALEAVDQYMHERGVDGVEYGEEVPLESIEAVQEALAKCSTQLSHVLLGGTKQQIEESLSMELWNWHACELSQEETDMVETAIARTETATSVRELGEALESHDPSKISAAVECAQTRGVSQLIPHFESLERLVLLQRCNAKLRSTILESIDGASTNAEEWMALIRHVEAECDFGEINEDESKLMDALERSEIIRHSSPESHDACGGSVHLTLVASMLDSETRSLKATLVRAKTAAFALQVDTAIAHALEEEELNLINEAIALHVSLERQGWLRTKNSNWARLKGVQRTKLALLVLEGSPRTHPAGTKDALFNACADLSVSEALGLSVEHPLFLSRLHEHRETLCAFLEKHVGLVQASQALSLLGLDRADELDLLTEADLRLANVPRIGARRILPMLVKLGEEARERSAAALRAFQLAHPDVTLQLSLPVESS